MFDIGFSEIVVIAVVALIVIGPERLPRVARTLGHLFGRAQRYVNNVKSDISREMAIDELRQSGQKLEQELRTVEQGAREEVQEVRHQLIFEVDETMAKSAAANQGPIKHYSSDRPAQPVTPTPEQHKFPID
jgi:sec-independent protein translocase protein TatB